MKILITWTTSWIWEFLAMNLKNKNEIFWVWRNENQIKGISFFKWDLKKKDFLEKIVKNIWKIDFVILNAWVWTFGKFHEIHLNTHKEILETNLISPILLSNLFLEKNLINKGIIFIWSIAGKKSLKLWASYAASKFWLRGFAMQLKNEYSKFQIHLLNPSIVKTNFNKNESLDFSFFKQTSLDEILKTIECIMNWEEKRFEIDL